MDYYTEIYRYITELLDFYSRPNIYFYFSTSYRQALNETIVNYNEFNV